jgi:ABC-2 type transport system permease protein
MNPTIVRLSAQALLGRRRGLVLVLIPLVLVVLAVVVSILTDDEVGYDAVANLGFTLALPLVALLAATAVLGPEVDDGSIVYLVGWAATMVLGALPLLVVGLVLDPSEPRQAVAWGVGAAVAGTAYTALFLGLASLTRHAVVIGLLFVLIWEGVLGTVFAGIRWVAIGGWGREVAAEVSPLVPGLGTGLAYAVTAAVLVVLGSLWFTGDRLRSFTLRGDE